MRAGGNVGLRAPGAEPFGTWALARLDAHGLKPTSATVPGTVHADMHLPKLNRPAQLRLRDCPPAIEMVLITPLCFRAGTFRVELAEVLLRLNLKATPGCWALLPSSVHEGKWVVFRHLLLDGCATTAAEFTAALDTAADEASLLFKRLPDCLRVG